jgi:transaldolase
MKITNATENMNNSIGPDVWLAGDPEDLKKWMDKGVKGIVTNTVVLKDMTDKYGSIIDLTKRYLDITDKKIAIEIDGHSTNELLDVGESFTKLSDQIILKIPMSEHALGAFVELKKSNVETFCTTIFSLNQAVLAANAGVTHLLPFCEPFLDVNKDSTELIREIKSTFEGWKNRPFITAALVRSVETAHKAIIDGADGIIIFWPIFEEMIKSKLTDEWNKTFLDHWDGIYESGNLPGINYKPHK